MAGLADIFNIFKSRSLEDVWKDKHAEEIARNQGAASYPDLRENMNRGFTSLAEATGTPKQYARGAGESLTDVAENLPVSGQLLAAEDVGKNLKGSNYLGATFAALGAIPGGGPEAKAAKAVTQDASTLGKLVDAAPTRAGRETADVLANATAPSTARTVIHPVSSVKLKTPIEEMNPTYAPMGELLPERMINPESLFGSTIIPMRGDPTIAGKFLTGVGGQTFERPVGLHGGPNFPRGPQQVEEGAGWASNSGPSTTLSNRAARISQETGAPVFGAYMKMSPTSGDYSTMMAETLREMVKLKPPDRGAVEALDRAMREPLGMTKRGPRFPGYSDFPGVLNMTDEWISKAGKGRTKLAELLDTKAFQDMGFPQAGEARHAITEPELLNTPGDTSGHSVIRFDPEGRVLKNPKIEHPTYAQQNVGDYEGRLPALPLDVLYGPEVRASTKPQFLAKILETKPPSVRVDQQTLDRVMNYLRSREGAAMGLGGAVAAGVVSQSQADELEEFQGAKS